MEFPKDDDGDALRQVAMNADITRPMVIDFMIAVPSREAGELVAQAASRQGYLSAVEYDDETTSWTCYCTCTMLATYDGIVAAQRELDLLSHPFAGYVDGWGTVGNQ